MAYFDLKFRYETGFWTTKTSWFIDVGRKISRGGTIKTEKYHQKASLHFISGGLEGALSMRPRAHPKVTLHQHQEPRITNFRKMHTILENLRPFSCEKALYPGPHLVLITPANVNLRRWLVRVKMYLLKECLLKSTLAVSCVKIQEAWPPCLPIYRHPYPDDRINGSMSRREVNNALKIKIISGQDDIRKYFDVLS